MKLLLYTLFILIGLAGFAACSEEDMLPEELPLDSPVNIQWKLESFGTVNDGNRFYTANASTQTPAPADAGSYLLHLKFDKTFSGTSASNTMSGTYTINDRQLSFEDILMTERNELGDGRRYVECFNNVQSYAVSYVESTKILRLYYTDDKKYFLQYKEVK